MFTALVLATIIAISAVVFVLATGFRLPKRQVQTVPEEGFVSAPPLGLAPLEATAEALLAGHGIGIESRVESGPGEVTITAKSAHPLIGGRYLLVCRTCPEGMVVPSTRLLEFRDEVRAAGAAKGMFLTDGYFSSDARYLLEDAPVSLINRGELDTLKAGGPPAAPGSVDAPGGRSYNAAP